jgi:aspartate dehydrogenase
MTKCQAEDLSERCGNRHHAPQRQRVVIVGMGAMGTRVAAMLREVVTGGFELACLVQRDNARGVAAANASRLSVFYDVASLLAWQPTLAIECAGHGAVGNTIAPLLAHGTDAVVVSVGALSKSGLRAQLDEAMRIGHSRLTLVSGAIGGLDALHAARIGGLDYVRYIGRKPPRAWLGSPAQASFDLLALDRPTVIFHGTAKESAALYPKNANVTAAVALAGIGFERTTVEMIADPGIDRNIHEIEARGAFGSFLMRLENAPLPDNPKTSWLAAMSVESAVLTHLGYSHWK